VLDTIQNILESSSKQLFVAVRYMNVGVRKSIFVKNQVFLGLAVYCGWIFLVLSQACLVWRNLHCL
jgi:hypothetical protein